MPTNHADDLRCKLNQAIERAVLLRGSYIDDIRHFSRDRTLPLDALIRFLLTMTGGTLNRELYDAGIEMAASSFVDRQAGFLFLLQQPVAEFQRPLRRPGNAEGLPSLGD